MAKLLSVESDTKLKQIWDKKQNQLTAGDNITIDGNTISAKSSEVDLSGYYTKEEVDALISDLSGKVDTLTTLLNEVITENNKAVADVSLGEDGKSFDATHNDGTTNNIPFG